MKHRIIRVIITAMIIIMAFILQSEFSLANFNIVATPNLLLFVTVP